MQQSRTKLFLIELIIIMLFFSFAGAACMNLFANAKILSTKSTQTVEASLRVQSAAEIFSSTKEDKEALAKALGGTATNNGAKVAYDENWQPTTEGIYLMDIAITPQGKLLSAQITMYDNSDSNNSNAVIYEISTKKYSGGGEVL